MSIQEISAIMRNVWLDELDQQSPQTAALCRSAIQEEQYQGIEDSAAEGYLNTLEQHFYRELDDYREDRFPGEDDNFNELSMELSIESQIMYVWLILLRLDRESLEFKFQQYGNARTAWRASMSIYSDTLRNQNLNAVADKLDQKVLAMDSPIAVIQWVTNLVEQHS